MKRIPYSDMAAEFERVLGKHGFSPEDAHDAAGIFAENSLCGVYSHGLNRFPRVVSYLESGGIDPSVHAECVTRAGCLERWDGHRGFGPLNAMRAMKRACVLAKEYGVGVVALGNNNHWMRGGTYGWLAAERGCIGICWSNSEPVMPAWGAKDRRLGNNPIIFSAPRSDGRHVMVDCALSQFSWGKVDDCRMKGRTLPVPGGYDRNGDLSCDPAAIEESGRFLPIGYWKGSGISILLDVIGTILSGGNAVHTVASFGEEVGLTQIMIAIDAQKLGTAEENDAAAAAILADVKASTPAAEGGEVRTPGEGLLRTREENQRLGIPVIEEIWNSVLEM